MAERVPPSRVDHRPAAPRAEAMQTCGMDDDDRDRSEALVLVTVVPLVRDAAQAKLQERGWSLPLFLSVMTYALADRPDDVLAILDRYQKEPLPYIESPGDEAPPVGPLD